MLLASALLLRTLTSEHFYVRECNKLLLTITVDLYLIKTAYCIIYWQGEKVVYLLYAASYGDVTALRRWQSYKPSSHFYVILTRGFFLPHVYMYNVLKHHDVKYWLAVIRKWLCNFELCFRYYLSGTDMTLTDYDGRTALHIAAAQGSTELLMMMIMMIK